MDVLTTIKGITHFYYDDDEFLIGIEICNIIIGERIVDCQQRIDVIGTPESIDVPLTAYVKNKVIKLHPIVYDNRFLGINIEINSKMLCIKDIVNLYEYYNQKMVGYYDRLENKHLDSDDRVKELYYKIFDEFHSVSISYSKASPSISISIQGSKNISERDHNITIKNIQIQND